MSVLSDGEIRRRLRATDASRLVITPMLDLAKQLGAGSVDLRLGSEFLEVRRQASSAIDPFGSPPGAGSKALPVSDRKSYVPLGDEFVLHPGQFVLGSTLEFVVLPADLVGQVLSRSSWGRLGLLVATAVVIQPGFKGVLTLELVNAGAVPIVLRPGLRIAQLQMWASAAPAERPYSESVKYDAPIGPESNKLAWEADEWTKLRRIADTIHARSEREQNEPPSSTSGGLNPQSAMPS